jgi:dipeptidyl aminopeptidase/acylaminoacyl peptidase
VALASRSYFVIAPNPRGSTGYGRAFEEGNRRDLGGRDLEDYVAGVRFLIDTGYVDARRVGITGTSYGGFMTIMALGRTPDVFAAGVEVCGITNWFSMYERGSPVLRAYQVGLLGDPVKDCANSAERSTPNIMPTKGMASSNGRTRSMRSRELSLGSIRRCRRGTEHALLLLKARNR